MDDSQATSSGLRGGARGGGELRRLLFVSNLFPDSRESYRGLDNVTVLHELRKRHACEVRVIAPRAWLPGLAARADWPPQSREVDACFAPRYVRAAYVPRFGSRFNHHLMRLSLARTLRQLRQEFPWDVLLASWLYPDGWAAAAEARRFATPCVLIAQGTDVHTYLKMPARKRRILEAVGWSAGVITRSRSLASMLAAAGAESNKLHPIPNGVDTAVFHPGAASEARASLGVPQDAKVLFFVGNLLPVKDPEMLVRAFAELSGRGLGGRLILVVAGKGPLRNEMERLAREVGVFAQTRFEGPVDSQTVAQWMRAADLLCLTSRNEGLPNVILEAQASGLPVVATDVGGIAEVVDAPHKGLLARVGDVRAWVDAAESLLRDPRDRRRIAVEGVLRDWDQTCERYWKVLSSAAKTG